MSRLILLVCLCMLSVGCASTVAPSRGTTEQPISGLATLAELPLGKTLVVDGASYTLIDRYVAASGRQCAQLRGDTSDIRIACSETTGQWYMRKSLLPTNDRSSRTVPGKPVAEAADTLPAAQDYVVPDQAKGPSSTLVLAQPQDSAVVSLTDVEPIVEPTVDSIDPNVPRVAVNDGETLWRFARRVTGNALNWEKIATYNGIDDAMAVRAGQMLAIPADLNVAGTGN